MYTKKQVGNSGEDIAAEFLGKKGYRILERNYRSRRGEIDIIAKDKDEIVFVEVKTRKVLKCGLPAEAVDDNKQKHLHRVAEYFLYRNNLIDCYCRFDVIEVYMSDKGYKIEHLKNVEIKP